GGSVSPPVFRRLAEATLRYLGVPPSINPLPPVIVARHQDQSLVPAKTVEDEPQIGAIDGTPPGTVPDVLGLSARDATRLLVKVGLSARLTGDGFVVTQEPPPGALVEEGGVCRLTLERVQAARRSAAV